MKKRVVVVNAGPRKGRNTDTILTEAAKGAASAGAEIQRFDLFRLEKYTGCISCFGCKRERFKGHCICRDGLTPVLDAIREADALIIGSPNYLGELSASFRALYERLIFQNLTYNMEKPSCNERPIPVLLVMTSNAPEGMYDRLLNNYQQTLSRFVGPTEVFVSGDTLQLDDYSKTDWPWSMFDPQAKRQRHETVFPEECRRAFEKGENLVKQIKGKETDNMIIKAVKFRKDGFYSQPFAFGGEEGPDKFDKNIRYRGTLQNYLIDTGDEVILVDTGLPAGTPEEKPDENSLAYTGKDICSYMEAFAALGYKPEQVTKILLTHRHSDHSGELRSFPNAKIYVNAEELDAVELQGIENIVPVNFTDGPYYNFPESQKIRDGIFMIKAKGHTKGNSIIIIENEGLFYMLHGDITYVDEALYNNKLSVVYDDLPAARETLDNVREFIRSHPTVYCGTHTPQGYENLEAKRVMDLDHPVETIPAKVNFTKEEASGKYVCSICGYVYDPAEHDGVAFEDLPDDWKCPRCRQGKEKFNKA